MEVKKTILTLCLLVVSYATQTDGTSCDSPWVSAGDSCFYITGERVKYGQAKEKCALMGGRVATFLENEFEAFKTHIGSEDYWVGLECNGDNCQNKEQWFWNDGTPVGDWTQQRWTWGEPDLGEGNARITDKKLWAGLFASFNTGYICKKGALPTTTTSHTTETTTASTSTRTPTTSSTRTSTTSTTTTTTIATPTNTPSTTSTTTTTNTATPTNTPSTTTTTTTANIPSTTTTTTNTPPTTTTSTTPTTTISTSTTGHAKPSTPTSTSVLTTISGVPLKSKQGPDQNLPIWISMGVISILGMVALTVGIRCFIKARRLTNASEDPENGTGETGYAHIDKSSEEAEYAELTPVEKELDSSGIYVYEKEIDTSKPEGNEIDTADDPPPYESIDPKTMNHSYNPYSNA